MALRHMKTINIAVSLEFTKPPTEEERFVQEVGKAFARTLDDHPFGYKIAEGTVDDLIIGSARILQSREAE